MLQIAVVHRHRGTVVERERCRIRDRQHGFQRPVRHPTPGTHMRLRERQRRQMLPGLRGDRHDRLPIPMHTQSARIDISPREIM